MNNRKKRAGFIILLFGVYGLAAIINLAAKARFGVGLPCISQKLFHIYCPGCGLTRMLEAEMQGQWYQAFRYNSFFFITGPFFGFVCILDAVWYVIKGKTIEWTGKFLVIYAIFLYLFGILRNFDMFHWLAPVNI